MPPPLHYTEQQMLALAEQVVRSHVTVTGVQPKLSLDISPSANKTEPKRLTIVGLWGSYILKPPTLHYPHTPEVEDLTMHLASIAKISVVPHSLIKLQSGQLAYITKRVDRSKRGLIHMEDMCQLTERLTEHKYNGSYEQIAKAILKYSANPGLDVVNFFEMVLFSFLIGNADMHLKNFSLLHDPGIGPVLSPAYDLLATTLVNPADNEEFALTLNGKKNKISIDDFKSTFSKFQLDVKQQTNIVKKMEKALPRWMEFIDISFLNDELKGGYKEIINERFKKL